MIYEDHDTWCVVMFEKSVSSPITPSQSQTRADAPPFLPKPKNSTTTNATNYSLCILFFLNLKLYILYFIYFKLNFTSVVPAPGPGLELSSSIYKKFFNKSFQIIFTLLFFFKISFPFVEIWEHVRKSFSFLSPSNLFFVFFRCSLCCIKFYTLFIDIFIKSFLKYNFIISFYFFSKLKFNILLLYIF